ncbi:Gluconate permease [Lactiplantibacillus plantarum]|nr:Gluconate permease [Lactiplantibacillus plantarum]
MPFVVLTLGILLLLLLIIKFKLNTYIALIVTAVVVGIGLGMPLTKIATSIQNGIGGQLGELALVFGFGAMLGRLVADAGGAYTISTTLLDIFGRKRLQIAIVVASFIIGIALFFDRDRLVDSNRLCHCDRSTSSRSLSRDSHGCRLVRHPRILTTASGTNGNCDDAKCKRRPRVAIRHHYCDTDCLYCGATLFTLGAKDGSRRLHR